MALTKNLTCFYQYIDWLSSFAEWAQLFWTTSSILEDAEKLNSAHHRYSFSGAYNCVRKWQQTIYIEFWGALTL